MDKISVEARRRNMRHIRSRDTGPEIAIRKLIYSLGYRYRVTGIALPGKPDLIFTNKKKVIFVHGCFWHQHNTATCVFSHVPKSRLNYWLPKFQRTRDRDSRNSALIKQLGWKDFVIWECELCDLASLTTKLKNFLG